MAWSTDHHSKWEDSGDQRVLKRTPPIWNFGRFFVCDDFDSLRVIFWRKKHLDNRNQNRLRLGGDLGLAVGDLDAELLGAGDNFDALP